MDEIWSTADERELQRKARIVANAKPKAATPTVDEYYANLAPRSGLVGGYISFGGTCRQITNNAWFWLIMNVAIMLAGVLVGLQTYPSLETNSILLSLNSLILGIFIVECFLKVFSDPLRPWRYWIGPDWAW